MTNSNQRWFVEELTNGRWSPALYHGDKPSPKKVEGKRKWRREPIRIPDHLSHLTLDQIAACYSPDGDFAAMHGVARET